MSKILILANHYNTLRVFRKDLIMALSQQGHEVIATFPECEDKYITLIESFGCQVQLCDFDRRGMNPIKDLKLLRTYIKLIKDIEPDIIITYTIKCNIYGGIAARKLKKRYYANVTGLGSIFQQNSMKLRVVTVLYKLALKSVKVAFFENEGNKKTLVDKGVLKEEQCQVLNGAGVNLKDYNYLEYPISKLPTRFLFVGRIMKEKGVDELFECITKMKSDGLDVAFDFIGWFEDDYKQLVDEMVNQGLINYYGFQEDVLYYLQKAHCVVLPSYHEGMSNTLLEAAAVGRARIASDIHGCKETILDGVNGYTCKVKSADSLYQQLIKFVALPYEAQKEMGLKARKYIEEHFDKKDIVDDTIKIIFGDD